MIVLGIDTATSATAVGLRLADGTSRQSRDDPRTGEHPGHATRLLELAAGLLREAELGWDRIDRIAVGVGPGTFTGLRVGIATARALAQSLSVEIVGVSSLAALAAPALAAAADGPSASGPDSILAVIDARRGEVFAAAYERSAGAGGEAGVAPHELTIPRALPPERLAEVLAETPPGTSGRRRRWLAVGDGAVRFAAQLDAIGIEIAPPDSPLHRIDASSVCALGAGLAPGAGPEEIVPDYRRRPDAELALETAGAASPPQT